MTRRNFLGLLGGLALAGLSVEALAAGGARGGGYGRGTGPRNGSGPGSGPRDGSGPNHVDGQPSRWDSQGQATPQPRSTVGKTTGQRSGGYGAGTGPRDGSGPGSGPRDGSGPNHVDGQPSRWDRQTQ